ncbi:hypothetical protein Acsp05_36990 [Actinokineospora sp. NBRC 105648]|nr:hypothetical protein Acsp05_36990 [Actinokineospora sp. NBRC 105648]
MGRSGETEWIPRVQAGHRPDEPFRFQEEPPEPPKNTALAWALRGAGLVAVAVVSGLIFWYVTDEDPVTPTQAAGSSSARPIPDGRFQFTAYSGMPQPKRDVDCAKNSHGKVKQFFADKPCASLTRALYTSQIDGKTVYTAVSVVRMPTAEDATALMKITDDDNTGNVDEPVYAGLVKIDGLVPNKGLGGGGYQSALLDRDLIVVESDWAPAAKRTEAEVRQLKDISDDALRLAAQISPGA